jgi:hypothetical protein
VPNLVGSVGWTSPTSGGTGNTTTPIPYVSGFQAGLVASKRLDPLVVFSSVSYFSSAARDVAGTRVDPSDVLGARFGGSLALSPASAVTVGFNLAYLTHTTAADFIVPNSDRVLSSIDPMEAHAVQRDGAVWADGKRTGFSPYHVNSSAVLTTTCVFSELHPRIGAGREPVGVGLLAT